MVDIYGCSARGEVVLDNTKRSIQGKRSKRAAIVTDNIGSYAEVVTPPTGGASSKRLAHGRAGVYDGATRIILDKARGAVVHHCSLHTIGSAADVQRCTAAEALTVSCEVIPVGVAGATRAGSSVERREEVRVIAGYSAAGAGAAPGIQTAAATVTAADVRETIVAAGALAVSDFSARARAAGANRCVTNAGLARATGLIECAKTVGAAGALSRVKNSAVRS